MVCFTSIFNDTVRFVPQHRPGCHQTLKILHPAQNHRTRFTPSVSAAEKGDRSDAAAKNRTVCPCVSAISTCTTVPQLPAEAQYGSGQFWLLTGGRPVSKQGCAKCRTPPYVSLLCPAAAETGTCERSLRCLQRFHSKHTYKYMANNHISLGLSRLVQTSSFQNKQETLYQPNGVGVGRT